MDGGHHEYRIATVIRATPARLSSFTASTVRANTTLWNAASPVVDLNHEGAAKYRPSRFSPVPFRWHSLYPRLYFVVPVRTLGRAQLV